MGVTIEQYRARIGAHNSIAKTKEDNSHLEGIIWNTMPILILLYHSVYFLDHFLSFWHSNLPYFKKHLLCWQRV